MKREQLLLDLIGCQKGLEDIETLLEVLRKLPKLIGMRTLTTEWVEGTIKPGYTGFVLIEESHIAIHTFTELKLVWVDICSCKSFNSVEAKAYLVKVFDPDEVREKEVR